MFKIQDSKPKNSRQLLLYFTGAILSLILVGCAPQIQRPKRVCPGAESARDSLSLLRLRSQNAASLKANGQCHLQYYDADGRKHNENFSVKLWVHPVRGARQRGADAEHLTSNGVNPPVEIYLQGDIAFDARGIVLGSNEDEFWLAMKPKAINSYWWGRWSEEGRIEKLMISPKLLLEAFGITAVGSEKKDRESWSLSTEGSFDVLTKREGRTETQKIYIEACDYLVRRIEYFDAERAVAVAELDKYKQIVVGFSMPAFIKIVTRGPSSEDTVSITFDLRSIKPASITLNQRRRLFTRPEPRGFEHIYKIVGGNMFEEKIKN
jgi:hypothetical protein